MKLDKANMKWSTYALGDHAFVFALDEKVNENIVHQISVLNDFIHALQFPFIKDLIPAYYTLTIIYDIEKFYAYAESKYNTNHLDHFGKDILNEFFQIPTSTNTDQQTRLLKIPVCYDLEFGIDLKSMAIDKKMSVDSIIQTHIQTTYSVYCLGFLPGFAYMGSVDALIQTPRHNKPRSKVCAGSVGIAGVQTGIYPMDSPGGWQIIGRCPLKIFDKDTNILAKFKVGDRIQFYPISKNEFDTMNQHNS